MHTDSINDIQLYVLYLLLVYPERQPFIFENTEADFFPDMTNRKIFRIAKALFEKGDEIDNVSVFAECKDKLVGERLVFILTKIEALSPFTQKYCKILLDNHIEMLIKKAETKDELEYIEQLKNKYYFVENKIRHISDGIDVFEDDYEKRINSSIITGYPEIDDNIGSFMGGDYIALGGGTGMGKTTIALNIARMVCVQGKRVLYCSLEMPLDQLRNRFNCMNTEINAIKYRTCGFTMSELDKYREGLKSLKDWNLFILTDYNLTTEKLKIYIQQQVNQTGVDFVIIDYLGLMSGYGNKSLYEKSTNISRKIKILATELNIPILVLVQLNRDLKQRSDKKPVLSDIRESGAIEQDADFVLFAHRESAYQLNTPDNDLTIIFAKNRHGKNNVQCNLDFDLKTQLIKSKNWRN